jgi:rubrerythrin
MAYGVRKTEHGGAKNGGGYRGSRVEAKVESKTIRRRNDEVAIREEVEMNQWYCFECRTRLGPKPPAGRQCPHCGSQEVDNVG